MCPICEHRHWRYQPHVLGRSGIRNVRVVAVRRAALPGKVMVVGKAGETGERVESSLEVVGRYASGGRDCERCGAALKKPLRGPWPRFCSDRCRKAKSRRGR